MVLNEFINNESGARIGPIRWANGIAFIFSVLPLEFDFQIEDYEKGKLTLSSIAFSSMKKFERFRTVVDQDYTLHCVFSDNSSNMVGLVLIDYIKKNLLAKK